MLFPAGADTVFSIHCVPLVSMDLEFLPELLKSSITVCLMEAGEH